MRYAEIVVNTPLRRQPVISDKPQPTEEDFASYNPLTMTFHYSLPPLLREEIARGQLVRVPFGSRRMQGVVLDFSDTSPVEQTKDVEEIMDPKPVLNPAQIALALWLSRYYHAPLISCVLLMLPPGIDRRAELVVDLRDEAQHVSNFTKRQRAVVEYLRQEGKTKLRLLGRRLEGGGWRSVVDGLVRKGVIRKWSELEPPSVRPKTERVARLIVDLNDEVYEQLSRAPRQTAIAEHLEGQGAVAVGRIYDQAGGSSSTLQAMEEKGLIALQEREVWRDPLEDRQFVPTVPPKLTEDQEAAWGEIKRSLTSDPPYSGTFLLHGVTGSGKTEIYLRAIQEIVDQGRDAIVLVPEISLTPQTIRRFGARFPERLAVLHSKLSQGERYDEWRRIRDGDADIVIGSRSAVFAPLPQLGLIVLDEEHEWSYKQQRMPRYHAREVALKYAELSGASVILGSATPDLQSYHRARRDEHHLLHLPQRIMGHRRRIEAQRERYGLPEVRYQAVGGEYDEALYVELPPVEVIDMRRELRAGNRSIFSRVLRDAMTVALAAGEQVILFLNRRGTATFVMCRDCGHVLKCQRCDVPLTYHSAEDDLVCHHCNYRTFVPSECPSCWSGRIKFFGTGTQKVEEVTQEAFPDARILRWDRDTTGGKTAHDEILEAFVQHDADVMIGTQMVAKGLDLPLVTLVGVIAADTALHLPDFRASERTFQLLTQVAGRAGRSILGGKVVVQTYSPEHYAIQSASRHDYGGFYRQEIAFRREQGYPPFRRLVKLVCAHNSEDRCQSEAQKIRQVLGHKIARLGLAEIDLIGPAPCFFRRLRGKHRWQIVIRAQDPHSLLEGMSFPLGWRVDVDPVSLL